MKCLTICQPYAWAMTAPGGLKRIENRPKPISYRGPLLIHAGRSTDWIWKVYDDDEDLAHPEHPNLKKRAIRALLPGLPPWHSLVFGAIVGRVEVLDCVPVEDVAVKGKPFAWGPHCIVTDKPEVFAKPIPWRGMLGLFEVPDEVVEEAMRGT